MDYKKLESDNDSIVKICQFDPSKERKAWSQKQRLLQIMFFVFFVIPVSMFLLCSMFLILSSKTPSSRWSTGMFSGHWPLEAGNSPSTTAEAGGNSHPNGKEHSSSSLVVNEVKTLDGEQIWVGKNFQTGFQVMKIKVGDSYSSMCYISKLEPWQVASEDSKQERENKRLMSTVYETVEQPREWNLEEILGSEGERLCRGSQKLWLKQVAVQEKSNVTSPNPAQPPDIAIYSLNPNKLPGQQNLTKPETGGDMTHFKPTTNSFQWYGNFAAGMNRKKRNIRQCRTSCCWMICCCEVHHFSWETVEEFNCVHVCNRCSHYSKQKVTSMC